jgi:gas vesicle protein
MAEKASGVDFVAGFLVGALVGAAAALLMAPQSGEETRTLIRDKGIELGHRADELSTEARRKAEDLQVQMKQAVEEGKVTATKKREELLSQVGKETTVDEVPIDA